MIIPNEIPLLEYDDSSLEVIAPNHDCRDLRLPEKCLFSFLGDVVHRYADDHRAEIVEELVTVSHIIRVYVLHEADEDICLVQSPIGAAAAMEKCFEKHGLPFVPCTTWTTDGFFRETGDMVKYRLEEGCSVVEMECAALAACCRKRGALFGQFLFTADSLANAHDYDARDFGTDSHEKALLLGLDILRDFR